MSPVPFSVAFVCVQNAGRSQMATAFAEQERRERGLEADVDVRTGGTRPADHVHDVVVDAMAEVGVDLTERTPRAITPDDLERTDVVVTMGCSAGDVCPATWSGETRDWALDDPDGKPLDEVREIRDDVGRRVRELFDDVEREVTRRV
jgi:protein-tyrosine-phosphatase